MADFLMSSELNEKRIFASISKEKLNENLLGNPKEMNDSIGFRIPSLLYIDNYKKFNDGVLLAFSDKGNDGGDWGAIGISLRRSLDNGKTFLPLEEIVVPPVRKQPYTDLDWGSAFYIDPLLVKAKNGDIILMADFFCESRGLHSMEYLEDGTGLNSSGKLILTDSKSPYNGGKCGNIYTVENDGFIYDSNKKRTNYYFPKNHNPLYKYQTFGDIYYTNGSNEYIEKYPPLIPKTPIKNSDIYVGNVFLNVNKPDFEHDNPKFIQKKEIREKYYCIETEPAPLRAVVTSHLVVLRSKDNGVTFGQPEFITHMVKNKHEKFFGTGPGVGICLEKQQSNKNGRILMPTYYLGKGYMLLSDDNGITFKSTKNDICVIDEIQVVELNDGRILAFGRQKETGKTPYSISYDGGENFSYIGVTDLISASCQKSFIMYPNNLGLNIILCSHNSSDGRVNGKISMGIVDNNNKIDWKSEFNIVKDHVYSCIEKHDFFGYSCLSIQKNSEIGLLYESVGRNCLSYLKVKLEKKD